MKKILIITLSCILAMTLTSCSLVGEFISEKLMKTTTTETTLTPSTKTSNEPVKSVTSTRGNIAPSTTTNVEPIVSSTTKETSTIRQTSTTTSTTNVVTQTEDDLTVSVNKTSYSFVYGVTANEIKNEISSNVVTNGVIFYPTISTACGTQSIRLSISKGNETEYKVITITINPNTNGFKSYLSTSTKNWYWNVNASKFEFNVYFKNNTGKDIASFNIDLAYSIDGSVRAAASFINNKLNSGNVIKNGEEFTFTFTITRNTSFASMSQTNWKYYYENNQTSKLQSGYDYNYWMTINQNINHNLNLIAYFTLNYA